MVRPGRSSPLVLMASKSWMGHSEPASGAAGLAHAQVAVNASLQLPVLHLGAVNPYVAAGMGKQAHAWAVPRQPAPLHAASTCGVSAFAFQGTNAHVVIQTISALATGAAPRAAPLGGVQLYSKQHFWVRPPTHRWVCVHVPGIHA
jgi:acyl transferase domain-containing protein